MPFNQAIAGKNLKYVAHKKQRISPVSGFLYFGNHNAFVRSRMNDSQRLTGFGNYNGGMVHRVFAFSVFVAKECKVTGLRFIYRYFLALFCLLGRTGPK